MHTKTVTVTLSVGDINVLRTALEAYVYDLARYHQEDEDYEADVADADRIEKLLVRNLY